MLVLGTRTWNIHPFNLTCPLWHLSNSSMPLTQTSPSQPQHVEMKATSKSMTSWQQSYPSCSQHCVTITRVNYWKQSDETFIGLPKRVHFHHLFCNMYISPTTICGDESNKREYDFMTTINAIQVVHDIAWQLHGWYLEEIKMMWLSYLPKMCPLTPTLFVPCLSPS